jgi:hypothetical protein
VIRLTDDRVTSTLHVVTVVQPLGP